MLWWFQYVQLAFALFVIALVAERMRTLIWREAISDQALDRLLRDKNLAERWARARPESSLARALASEDAREDLADAREIASARLRLLRVCATLASTLGLLGGILLLSGAELPDQGLLALEAGAIARARMNGAITTMAIGVASSAFCFSALSLLRKSAQKHLAQANKIERAHTPLTR